MLKADAVSHFGSQAEISRKLDISSAAVAKWGDVVPLESATALEILSGGAVTVNASLYPALARATSISENAAA